MGGLFQIRARAIKEESGFGLRQAGPEFEESRRRPPRNQQRIQNRHPGPQGVTVDPGGSTTPPQHGLQAGSAVDLGPFAATPSLLPQSGGGPSPRNLRPTPSPLVAMHSPSPPPPSPPSQGQNTEMGSMLGHYPVHLMPQDGVDAIPPPLQDPFPLTVVGQPQPFNAPRHLPETLGFLGTRGEIIPVDGGYTLVETTSVISSGLANRLRGPRRPKPASWVAGEMKNVTVAISKGGHGDFEEVELWMEIVPALGNGDFSLSLAAWMRINQVRDKHAAAFSDTNVPPVPYQPLSPQRTNTISNFDQAVYTNPTAGVDTIPMVVTDVTLQDSNLTNPMTVDSSRSGAYATSQNYQNQDYVMRPGQTSTPFLQHAFIPDPLHRPPDYGYGSQSGFTAPYSQGHLEQMSALFKTYPGSFGNVQEEFMPVPPQRLPEYGYDPQLGSTATSYQGYSGYGCSTQMQQQQGQMSHTINTFHRTSPHGRRETGEKEYALPEGYAPSLRSETGDRSGEGGTGEEEGWQGQGQGQGQGQRGGGRQGGRREGWRGGRMAG